MPDIDAIIDRLGGAEAAARLAGVGTEAVRKWRQAGLDPLPSLARRHWRDRPLPRGAVWDGRRESVHLRLQRSSSPARTPPWSWPTGPCSGAAASACTRPDPLRSARSASIRGMTGYQETLTDPSYAGQIITFTFPHIGNVGVNPEDIEATTIDARGLLLQQDVTEPSSWRSAQQLDAWLRGHGVSGVAGVDTRALTIRIRDGGPPNAVLAFPSDGQFDVLALRAQAAEWPGLEGMDLAKAVSCTPNL